MLTINFDFKNCQKFVPLFAETSPTLKNSWLRTRELIEYSRTLKALIILFLLHICLYEFMFQIKMGKFRKKRLADSNADAVKTTLRLSVIFKLPSFFFAFFKNLSPFLCHFITYNKECYKWLCRLRHHIQVARLSV